MPQFECIFIAGKRPLFDMSLRKTQPQHYAVLVATFFKTLGGDQAEFPANNADLMAELMLSLLTDLKDMTLSWQREKFAGLLSKMIDVFLPVADILCQVSLQRVWTVCFCTSVQQNKIWKSGRFWRIVQ